MKKWNKVAPITGPHKVPLPPSIAISTMNTPISLPSNATSVESIYPISPPMIPPARPQKNAEHIQPVILYFIVWMPIASALSSLSLIAFKINLNLEL